MPDIVNRYLKAVSTHDWAAFSECLSDDVVRVGPFGDTYRSKEPYVRYISKLMPTLEDYSMRVERVTESGDITFVELTESMSFGGKQVVTPEVLVFETDRKGLISKVDIFIKTLGDAAPKVIQSN